MEQSALPIDSPESGKTIAEIPVILSELRFIKPVRNQSEMMVRDLESLVAEDHQVRAIWEFLNRLDLSAFYCFIKAAMDKPGRPAATQEFFLPCGYMPP